MGLFQLDSLNQTACHDVKSTILSLHDMLTLFALPVAGSFPYAATTSINQQQTLPQGHLMLLPGALLVVLPYGA